MKFNENKPSAAFISIIHKEHAKYINENVKDEDLSFGLHPILIIIYENEGINQEKLAEVLHLNESTITRNLKKLEDKGFIERIKNKRKKIIKLTSKGRKTAQKVINYDYKWDEKLKQNLTEEEYANFLEALRTICEELL
ncbi:DNA-binding transcriptional regulator, MarR family [Methanobrevibacter gottschalkii]|uniref:DNA-binding MarR family transcriptional regulator n=2 Tax=Methanobrevibacter gottschalkii TaxID=190974 RepID=A0A3N5BBK4_9EURY|nr:MULTISPECIES: MarR family transcriptional regulator [Methanobrevibacter]MCQ2970656.1 MarR family transcriptional regulator [archaeon]OEC96543.1 hypothetical protein A9505_06600 [Methanobrevibacter sp. A27]RPF52820.1 DNA-binding MarR family transcriptional regulator [Methanobrevibacter gottschalkii DSM 11977]SEK20452.1 DNA-binding transcriptional regulator, MarR family [Methanobrevibacter gottschalkii]